MKNCSFCFKIQYRWLPLVPTILLVTKSKVSPIKSSGNFLLKIISHSLISDVHTMQSSGIDLMTSTIRTVASEHGASTPTAKITNSGPRSSKGDNILLHQSYVLPHLPKRSCAALFLYHLEHFTFSVRN